MTPQPAARMQKLRAVFADNGANAQSQAIDEDDEGSVESTTSKCTNHKPKGTFNEESIPQLLNGPSEKENTIVMSNWRRKTRTKKDKNGANKIMEARTR